MKCRFILFVLSFALLSTSANAQLQLISTVAGTGDQGYTGDGNAAVTARFSGPLGIAVDAAGNMYIEDRYNNRVRRVNPTGVITTIAGNGTEGFSGDGSISSSAVIMPTGVAVDRSGNIYISDASHSVVRKINNLGIISRVAGTGTFGHTGDGGAATSARIGKPYGITVDTGGNLFIADAGMHVVRRVSKAGIITTVAGSDLPGYTGDGGMATDAKLDSPYSVATDHMGNLFISDFKNNVIRVVDVNKEITTYAGIYGNYNYTGDGGMAILATLNQPRGIAVDTAGNLYIADAENNVIRKVASATGKITTVVGNGSLGYGGDGGYAVSANLHNPHGVTVDRFGSIYVADANNQLIRKAYNPFLAVNELPAVPGISLFPNPCSNVVTIKGLNKGDNVCVYDVVGRAVTSVWNITTTNDQSFNIAHVAPGTYQLQVADATGAKKTVIKLVKE